MKKTVFALIALLAISTSAQASPRFSIVGLGDMGKMTGSGSYTFPVIGAVDFGSYYTYTAKMSFGGGVLVDFPMSPKFSLELGGLYVPRKMEKATSGSTDIETITANFIQVPVALRYWFSPVFSLGVGGYVGVGNGDYKTVHSNGTADEVETFSGAGFLNMEYGALASVSAAFPIGSSSSLVIDGRYLMGLSNQLNDAALRAAVTAKYTDIQGLVGIRFGGNK